MSVQTTLRMRSKKNYNNFDNNLKYNFSKHFLLILLSIILFITPVLAYDGWYGGFGGPTLEQFFGSEWAQFALVFLIFFGLMFWALGKTIENRGAAAVISVALALFAAFALIRTSYFYGYFGTFIPNLVLAGLVLFILVFLLNILARKVSPIAVPIVLFVLWLLLRTTSPYDILPYEFLSYTTVNWYNSLIGFWGLVLIIIISVIVIGLKPAGEGKSLENVFNALKGKINDLIKTQKEAMCKN